MTQQLLNGAPEVRDFTPEHKEPIRFRIYGDTYEAAPELPAGTLIDFVGMADRYRTDDPDGGHGAEALGLFTELFDAVLLPASAERFRTRLRDLEQPIPIGVLPELVTFLLEQYTGRPLAGPGSSSDGSGNAGISSTAGSPSPGSIPVGSPPTAS